MQDWFSGHKLLQFWQSGKLSFCSEWQHCQLEYAWLKIFPLQQFEYIMPLPSGLSSFCWEISSQPNGSSLQVKDFFSLAAYRIFSLSLYFSNLTTICLDVGLLLLILMGVFCVSWIWICFTPQSKEVFRYYFSTYFFCPLFS